MYAVRKGRRIGVYTEWKDCEEMVKGFKGAEYCKVKTEEEGYAYINGVVIQSKYFYAVKYANGKSAIFRSWDECKEAIKGKGGTEYKKFKTEEDAIAFITGGYRSNHVELRNPDLYTFYIDGSFKDGKTGFGVLQTRNGKETCYRGRTTGMARNISGEISALCFVLHTMKEYDIHEANIVYDYDGILFWLDGTWKCRTTEAESYKEFVDRFMYANNIKLHFYKTKSHSGVDGNNMADRLAKAGADNGIFIPQSVLFNDELDVKMIQTNV